MAATRIALMIRRALAAPQRYRVKYGAERGFVERIDIFLTAIAKGVPTCHAAALGRLPYHSVRAWLNPKHNQYRASLYREFERAKALCVIRHIEKINASKDWRAHAWWLAHMTEEFAGKKARDNDDGKAPNSGIVMDAETIKELSEAHDQMMERLAKQAKDSGKER